MRKAYTFHSKEEKLELVKRHLSGESTKNLSEETGISRSNLQKWKHQYLNYGEAALINKKKPGNSLAKYHRKKNLSHEEKLEYENALLKRELLKKDGIIIRLKKSIELEGEDVKRK